jgi:hypothetical protein
MTRKTKINTKKIETNIIKIGDKDLSVYITAFVFKAQPVIYDKFGSIKFQVAGSPIRLEKANYLVSLFKNFGFVENERQVKEIMVTPETGDPYKLKDVHEITLKKIPALLGW